MILFGFSGLLSVSCRLYNKGAIEAFWVQHPTFNTPNILQSYRLLQIFGFWVYKAL